MKEQILKLRACGKTYNEIQTITGCSKGTISYHCGEGQREKNLKRSQKRRHLKALDGKVRRFLDRKRDPGRKDGDIQSNNRKCLQDKADNFQRERIEGGKLGRHIAKTFTYKDVLRIFGETTTCYLTGKSIDLKEPRTYHFDHVVPVSKGGENTINNLGIACRDANLAKSDMNIDVFLQLCKEVLEHNGYKIIGSEAKSE